MKLNVVPKLTSTHPLQGSVPDKIDLSDSHQNPPDLGVDMFEINVPKNITSTSSQRQRIHYSNYQGMCFFIWMKKRKH